MAATKKRPGRYGPDNPFWRGGRSLASNGYVLIRVGVGHHLADVRGYAYEHRVIAEKKMGRKLRKGEQVHHINGDKQDNRPENLEVVESVWHHQVKHRKQKKGLRMPGEANCLVACECGCGGTFLKFDSTGRPRRYISGHNPSNAPSQSAILQEIRFHGTLFLREIIGNTGLSKGAVLPTLRKLIASGKVKKVCRGCYCIAKGQIDGN